MSDPSSAEAPSTSQPDLSVAPAPACRLCGAPTAPWFSRHGFPIVRCPRCGFGFALIPEGFDFHALYQEQSYWTGGSAHGYQDDYDQAMTAGMLKDLGRRLRRLAQYRPPPGALLEIGCAAGYFLRLAQRGGWRVEGVEISDLMRARAAERVDCPLFASLDEVAEHRYDCVAMFEVLEHVSDPVAMARQVAGLLRPGGVLALSTPNFESRDAQSERASNVWFEPPAHISYFGPKTLLECLRQAGLVPLELETRVDQFPPLPGWLATLLHPLAARRRSRPHGLTKKLMAYWRARQANAQEFMSVLVAYARKPD